MRYMVVVAAVVCAGCAESEPVTEAPSALTQCPDACDAVTPPHCASLAEAQFAQSSPQFAPWFAGAICPEIVDIAGELTTLEPWFCDSAGGVFPEACMPVYGTGPTIAIQMGCCHPKGRVLHHPCKTSAACPAPESPCFAAWCNPQTNTCAENAKPDGAACPGGTCSSAVEGDMCTYSGPPPVCVP